MHETKIILIGTGLALILGALVLWVAIMRTPLQMPQGVTAKTDMAQTASTSTSTSFTLADIAPHNTATSCYMAIRGTVYDVTAYIASHPGGAAILQGCGKDATALYERISGHQSRRAENELAPLAIGTLMPS